MASLKESLRRLYHDLVIRRSSVRVVPAVEHVDAACVPIFLIGVYRSGTTLLRYIVDSHSRICCPPESFFVAALTPLLLEDQYRLGLLRMGFDEEHVLQRIRSFCSYFFSNYAASHRKPRWADKSPSYVDHLDSLNRIFPGARFIMIYRHGFDQAHSFTRGGTLMRAALEGYCQSGEDLRVGAVRYWREKVEIMMQFEQSHPDQCMRIQYEDFCEHPEARAKRVFEFIGEEWEPQVLEFYRFQHDKGAEDGRVLTTRGFSPSRGHYEKWPAELRKRGLEIALPPLASLNYVRNET